MWHTYGIWLSRFSNVVVSLTMLLAACNIDASANGVIWLKSHVAPNVSCLDLRNAMVALTTLITSCDAILLPMVSMTKSYVAPYFSFLKVRNVVEQLMMLLTACGTDANANGIKLPEEHIAPHFNCLDLRNAVVPLALHATRAGVNGATWPKSYLASNFDHLDLGNAMVPLMVVSTSCDADTNAVVSHDKKVMLYLISINLT